MMAGKDVFFAGFILASQPALIYQAEYFPEFKKTLYAIGRRINGQKISAG
ncbi:MAG: hypothetical protein U5M23_00110 [Marinagarivorans sp.]|nr:hypothetical protein [Marinagarivorans sp.]